MTRIGNIPLSRRHALLAIVVLLSICVRVAHLAVLYPTPPFTYHRTWTNSDMYIFDQWAQRIVAGDILSRQRSYPVLGWMLQAAPAEKWQEWFGEQPAFLKAPLYAYLIALLRALFGDPMLPLAVLQILASTVSAVLLFTITERLFDTASAFAAALLFSLYAPAIHYDVVMLRGPWVVLVALLVTYQLVRMRGQPTRTGGCLLGALVGLALLVNEGFLLVPPIVMALLAWWLRDARRIAVLCGAFLLGLTVALLPLIVRNVMLGVPPLQLTPNGGSLFYATCNAGDSDPVIFRAPAQSFRSLIDASGGNMLRLMWRCLQTFPHGVPQIVAFYFRRWAALVAPFENPDNFNFHYAALRDPFLGVLPTYAALFPLGVIGFALATPKLRILEPLLPVPLTQFLTLMATLPMSRYRVTLVVFFFPLAGLALARLARQLRAHRFTAAAATVAAACLVGGVAHLLERRVVFLGQDAPSWFYRSVEFRLNAHLYEGGNRFHDASRELMQLAEFTQGRSARSDLMMRAAKLEVQAGNTAAAQAALQSLSRANDTDPKMLMSIGDFYWYTLGDLDGALDAYRRAITLDPSGPLGSAVRQRIVQLERTRE